MGELTELISYLNQSGGVPLTITTTQATNWSQFGITIFLTALSSIFILIYLWEGVIQPYVAKAYAWTLLKSHFKQTNRHTMIIKHTSSGLFDMSMISQATLRKVIEGLDKFKGKDFDLVLYTPGGEIFSSLYISRLLRNYPGKVHAHIPVYAMSGGTLLALSCDTISMNDNACLGPVDPQLGSLFKFGSAKAWNHIVRKKGNKAEDSSISMAMMGTQYTKSIYNHIHSLLGEKVSGKKAKELCSFLTNGDVEHAYPLTPSKLQELGLEVKKIDPSFNSKISKLIQSKMFEGVYFV